MAETPVKTQKEVTAHARHVHMSPQKLRLVADIVRNTRVDFALEQLRFSSRNAAMPIIKLLNSAIANAIHNYDMKKEDLFLKAITVDGGPVLKKMIPRAQGRGFIERKRTSHINVILTERINNKANKRRAIFTASRKKDIPPSADKPAKETPEGKAPAENDKAIRGPKTQDKIKQNKVAGKRRLFNRKSGE